jgi:hypothetical protein
MEETIIRERRMEASSEGGQSPEGTIAPWMDGWKSLEVNSNSFHKYQQSAFLYN